MKKGSMQYQVQQVFLTSGIFYPGVSKHEVKLRPGKGVSVPGRIWEESIPSTVTDGGCLPGGLAPARTLRAP